MSSTSYGDTSLEVREDLGQAVRDHLGREPDSGVWGELERDGYLADAHRDIEVMGVPRAKVIRELVSNYRTREQQLPARRELEADSNALALSRILAIEAAQRPEVKAIRRDLLRDRLLKPGKVAAWIERQASRDGKPTQWVEVPLDDTGTPQSPGAQGAPIRHRVETLSYPSPDGAHMSVERIRIGGVLWRLKMLAQDLCRRYPGWQEAQAVDFILTGRSPLLPLARVRVERGWPYPQLRAIVLEVSPRLSPPEVAAVYRTARTQILGEKHRDKPVREKSAALAEFVAEHNDGRSWAELMRAWNAAHRERKAWQHAAVRRFTRDCREAFERITGTRLEWRGAKGRRT